MAQKKKKGKDDFMLVVGRMTGEQRVCQKRKGLIPE